MSGEEPKEAFVQPNDRPSTHYTAKTPISDLSVHDLQELMKAVIETHLPVFDKWWKPEPGEKLPSEGKGFKEKPEPGERLFERGQYVFDPYAISQLSANRLSGIDQLIQ